MRYTVHQQDSNHVAICKALEAYGATIFRMGDGGMPDLLCVVQGRAWPVEIKTKHGKLRPSQARIGGQFAAAGLPVWILRSVEDVLQFMHHARTAA